MIYKWADSSFVEAITTPIPLLKGNQIRIFSNEKFLTTKKIPSGSDVSHRKEALCGFVDDETEAVR